MGKRDLFVPDASASTGPRGGLRGLLDALGAIHAADRLAVLGVVVSTQGSTYQKPGALVLLDRSGVRSGVISGGCLEAELEARAAAVFETATAQVTEFDTRSDEDQIFGSGTGCRGHLSLALLPLPPSAPLALALRALDESRARLELLLNVRGENVGAGVAHIALQHWSWNRNGQAVRQALAHEGPQRAAEMARVSIIPSPHLLLLGAGPETPMLVAFARRMGWRTTVVEHRGRWADFGAEADQRLGCAPAATASMLDPGCADAVVVMGHNVAMDLQHLRFCAQSNIAYVGLLGPPARRDALLIGLGESLAARLQPRLHAPVGLLLGGNGPEAIALAIAAELQQQFARRATADAVPAPDSDGR